MSLVKQSVSLLPSVIVTVTLGKKLQDGYFDFLMQLFNSKRLGTAKHSTRNDDAISVKCAKHADRLREIAVPERATN